MPNWCSNVLTVAGSPARVAAFVEAAHGTPVCWEPNDPQKPTALSFHALVPVPDAIVTQGFDGAGYDWCRKYWGTKWQPTVYQAPTSDEIGHLVEYSFDTAWTPPQALFDTVAVAWPALQFTLRYAEPGTNNFGETCWYRGHRLRDTTVSPHTIDWLADYFPEFLPDDAALS